MAGTAPKKPASNITTPVAKKTPLHPTRGGSSAVKKNANTSILSFFKKTDPPQSNQPRLTEFGITVSRSSSNSVGGGKENHVLGKDDEAAFEGLFVEDKKRSWKNLVDIRDESSRKTAPTKSTQILKNIVIEETPDSKESETKRFNESAGSVKKRKVESPAPIKQSKEHRGPFIDESDSDEDGDDVAQYTFGDTPVPAQTLSERSADPPPLVRAATSNVETSAVADDFDDIEDELEREDFMDQPWMAEEARAFGLLRNDTIDDGLSCPICEASLIGQSDSEASLHVNACLDGNPQSLPEKPKPRNGGLTRQEKRAIARPAQRNPFATGSLGTTTSAFTKLMAGNAEDTAWAAAAANEMASRGKQSYERTCPFYKILPGFSITVDAFRYGAVEGCEAYFLSHFHSDHYGGLTGSWSHGLIYCSKITGNLVRQQLKVDPQYVVDLEFEKKTEVPNTKGVYVTMIPANHCPGSSLFLFERIMDNGRVHRILHCGDFRACPAHVQHPLLRPDFVDKTSGQSRQQRIDVCYLDTTYLNPKYSFPSQEDVIKACADMCVRLSNEQGDINEALDFHKQGKEVDTMSKYLNTEATNKEGSTTATTRPPSSRGRLLVVIGTYSIGKERICIGIARALKCKIYAPPQKQRVCACLEDAELTSLLTDDPLEAQIHMQILFEIRAETLADYLQTFKGHFSRVVGFRPTGWTYRPPGGRLLDNPPVANVLHSKNWKTSFGVSDLVPQRGSTKDSSCFGVPYSEHSSFRELTMFCCALRIGRIIPTVNVGSAKSREKMKAWVDRWESEKRKSGLYRVEGDVW